jgi:Thioredoxin
MRSDMKRTLLALAASTALSASAQTADTTALRAYATKAMPRCPGALITLEPVRGGGGPAGFIPYTLTQRSSDETCGAQKYFLYAPASQQVLIGSVIPLPVDARPAGDRIAQAVLERLKKPVKVTIAPFPLPDGLRAVTMTRDTPHGPFSYHGFLDAQQVFLIVGSRGNLRTDPGQSLLDSINMSGAVRRGNPKAKVKIIELSDFQCPTCARAHKKVEPIITKNLSKIDYYRIDLPLFEHHEWAMDAALGARAIARIAPAKYWAYVDHIFENQDVLLDGKQPFLKMLRDFCEDRDISWAAVEKIVKSPAERTALLDQVSRSFDVGVNSTPTYIVNGQVLGFGPEGTFTIEQIKKAIGVK